MHIFKGTKRLFKKNRKKSAKFINSFEVRRWAQIAYGSRKRAISDGKTARIATNETSLESE